MKTYTVQGAKDYVVIVKGPLEDANRALGVAGIHRPYRDVFVNGLGAVHAIVSADESQLAAWFAATHDRGPGSLLWYQSHGRE